MTRRVDSDLLLVGSLPVSSTEEALRAGGELFGDLVFALPDGETGPREAWTAYESMAMLGPNPGLEVVNPPPPGGIPRHMYEIRIFGVREGVSELHFDSWPRIDDAIESYGVFRKLRDEGVIPSHLRFQVGLPWASSVFCCLADFRKDIPVAERAYEDLIARELKRLLDAIPAEDLAIQWDVCWEVLDLEGVVGWMGGDAWERFAGPVKRLTHLIPEETLVGYHLCYGTMPVWPIHEARDLGLLVEMANYAMDHSGRRVDWLHLAGPRDIRSEDDRYFEPLRGLRAGDTRVFLGIILPADGVDGLRRRYTTASRYLDDFGVAMYCGFGRQPGEDGSQTMRNHRDTVVGYLGERGALSAA